MGLLAAVPIVHSNACHPTPTSSSVPTLAQSERGSLGIARASDHPKRAAIFALVLREPGIHFRAICSELRYPAGTTAHHLRMLRKRGLIWQREYNSRLCTFPFQRPGIDDLELAQVARHALDPTPERIVAAMRELGRCHQKALLAHPFLEGVPRSSVQHHIRALVSELLLTSNWSGRYCFYSLPVAVATR